MVIMDYEEDEWPSTSWRFNWSEIHLGFALGLAGASLKVALTPQMHQELHWECIGTSVLMLMHPKIQMKNAKIQKNIAKGTTEPGINYFNWINNWKNQTISFTSHKPNSHRSDCKWRNLGQTSAWFGLAEGKNICNNWQIHVSTWRNLGPTSFVFHLGPQLVI